VTSLLSSNYLPGKCLRSVANDSDQAFVGPVEVESGIGHMVEHRCIELVALPPNQQLQLTVKSVTPFAEQRSRHFCLQLS
jgi:hypothetical protein